MKAGDVVVVRFPFSDLSGSKLRPSIVLAEVGRQDFIACQVTSNPDADATAIELRDEHLVVGGLKMVSFVRPGKRFTFHASVAKKRVGQLSGAVTDQIKLAVIELIRQA